jgi:hypothetical protein
VKFLTLAALFAATPFAFAKLCNPAVERCWKSGSSSTSSPAYPSRSSNIKINPSAVPLENIWGGEVLYYDGDADFGIVKGLGRVGAAISASNGEETFFGPMGYELDTDYEARLDQSKKYKSQKMAFAGAVGLYGNKKGGLKRLQVNVGVIGKYNSKTEEFFPGGGLQIVGGPLTLGYSYSKDNYLIDYSSLFMQNINYKYSVETFSAGLSLNSVAVDYSHLRVHLPYGAKMDTVSLLTGSLLLQKWILTAASRHESSSRPSYDWNTRSLRYGERDKFETFGGVQFSATKVLMIGVFHNYYLLREISLGATLFF